MKVLLIATVAVAAVCAGGLYILMIRLAEQLPQ